MKPLSADVFTTLADRYRAALFDDVVPFWLRHSRDQENGGYLTCLARDGHVYDTDKFTWLQAREVWLFAMLADEVEARPEWLTMARHGAAFLAAHGRDAHGDWYFALNRQGQALVQPYNIFSDCFAALAFARLGRLDNNQGYQDIAASTYQQILRRAENPKGIYNKLVPGTRESAGLGLPMILSNLNDELHGLVDPDTLLAMNSDCLDKLFNRFRDPDLNVIMECVGRDGQLLDTLDGRLIDPGHGIESMWFAMQLAEQCGNHAMIADAVSVILSTLEMGWDPIHGGLFYFMDIQGHPPDKLEWDQKLWWVHLETLIALLMAYRLTRSPACWEWFERVDQYTWAHFPDPEHGEWFGYLDRRGEVLLPLKGGKWKGCFHVPRGLYRCMRELEVLASSA
ncbi:MAG: AGE family epimerase/isomerase [Verrucomicrobia bacterium]|nr:AGE family epimerase/isomerase [Verrucomicrobiota bacterium]